LSQQDKNIADRKFTRIPKGIHIEIKKLEYPFSINFSEKGTTKNIAKCGICFNAPTQYEAGDILSLTMTLNGWHLHRNGLTATLNDELSVSDVLTVIAEVIWSKYSASLGGYDIGVKFINIYEDDVIALEKYFPNILPDN